MANWSQSANTYVLPTFGWIVPMHHAAYQPLEIFKLTIFIHNFINFQATMKSWNFGHTHVRVHQYQVEMILLGQTHQLITRMNKMLYCIGLERIQTKKSSKFKFVTFFRHSIGQALYIFSTFFVSQTVFYSKNILLL